MLLTPARGWAVVVRGVRVTDQRGWRISEGEGGLGIARVGETSRVCKHNTAREEKRSARAECYEGKGSRGLDFEG